MVAIKDSRWRRPEPCAKSQAEFCPLGDGEVRWPEVFRVLNESRFSGPVSLHVVYTTLADENKPERERMMKVASQDLKFLKKQLSSKE